MSSVYVSINKRTTHYAEYLDKQTTSYPKEKSVTAWYQSYFFDERVVLFCLCLYIQEGEPYLYTPYGTMICLWDGIVHYSLAVWILFSIATG